MKNELQELDQDNTRTVGFDKFNLEAMAQGIALSPEDLHILLLLFEDRQRFDRRRNVPAINYDQAIKVMVPVLTKNNDRKYGGQTTFKLGWTVTQQAKTKASILARVADEDGTSAAASVASSQKAKQKSKWSKKNIKL